MASPERARRRYYVTGAHGAKRALGPASSRTHKFVTVFRMRCRLGLDNRTVEFEATRFEVYSLLQHAFLLRHGNAAHIDQMFDFHRPNSPKLK